MGKQSDSPIVVIVSRVISPFIQLFALYVIFHGHYSPGGGFQGGAMLAASLLLMRLSVGSEIAQLQFSKTISTPLAAIGVLIFAGVGLIALVMGGNFLEYKFLPLSGMTDAALRSFGILLVEAGVGIGVMATVVSLYDDLLEGLNDA